MTPEPTPAFDLFLDRDFFSPAECRELVAELARAPASAGTVYGQGEGGAVDERMRKVTRLQPSPAIVERIRQRLVDAQPAIAARFGVSLGGFEELQFLRYRTGDFFVAHQDGNTATVRSNKEQTRKISAVMFLSPQAEVEEPGAYGGGHLVFTEWRPGRQHGQYALQAGAGTLVAFPADTTHEVTPVTWGDRYSVVSWYG